MNVAVVVLDTARATDAVGGGPDIMPHLSRLAAAGTPFTRAYTTAPWTLPSHASLFTGTYTSSHGAHGDHTELRRDVPTLPETLQAAGYETVGHSNNTWISGEFGFDRGFETFRRGWQYRQSETDLGPIAHELDSVSKVKTALSRVFQGNPLVNGLNLLYAMYRPDEGAAHTTDAVIRWLQGRSGERPFFLFCNYLEPHIPYTPPRSFAEPFLPDGVDYEAATAIRQDPRAFDVGEYDLTDHELSALLGLYRGELAYVDAQLGRLITAMQSAGVWENTLLVVLGDHGENIGDHGFLGHQYNVYDTLLHVPLVVHGGPYTGGEAVENLVQLLDIPQTVCSVLGLEDTDHAEGPGRPLPPIGTGRDRIIAEYVAPQPPVATLEERFGDLPPRVRAWDRSLRTLRTNEWKLIRGSDGHTELYNVEADPAETVDQSATATDTLADLEGQLAAWREERPIQEAGGGVAVSQATAERLASLGYR